VVLGEGFLFGDVQYAQRISEPEPGYEEDPVPNWCKNGICEGYEELVWCRQGDCCNDGFCVGDLTYCAGGGDCCTDFECSGDLELEVCPNGGYCGCPWAGSGDPHEGFWCCVWMFCFEDNGQGGETLNDECVQGCGVLFPPPDSLPYDPFASCGPGMGQIECEECCIGAYETCQAQGDDDCDDRYFACNEGCSG
jgi:hypothetical protein